MIAADGAPFDQGQRQGEALAQEIASAVRALRARLDLWSWRAALREAGDGPARALECYLPQHHERLQGIARGSGIPLRQIALLDASTRIDGMAGACKSELAASFDFSPDGPGPVLRHSVPDAGGSPSVELTAGAWVGCLAGVNARGIAVVCVEDRGMTEPSLRVIAQDLLFRGRDLAAGIEHIRRRAAYLGGSGRLLVTDAAGQAYHLDFRGGQLRVESVRERADLGERPSVRVDARRRTLAWYRGDSEAVVEVTVEADRESPSV